MKRARIVLCLALAALVASCLVQHVTTNAAEPKPDSSTSPAEPGGAVLTEKRQQVSGAGRSIEVRLSGGGLRSSDGPPDCRFG